VGAGDLGGVGDVWAREIPEPETRRKAARNARTQIFMILGV